MFKNILFSKNKYNDYSKMEEEISFYNNVIKSTNVTSLKDITLDYIDFYKNYQTFLQKKINKLKSEEELFKYYNHYIRINILYNNYCNYSFYMMSNLYFKSYKNQNDFINNKIFINHLYKYTKKKKVADQVVISMKLKILLSILCFKNAQDISKQAIEFDFNKYYDEISNEMKTNRNRKNRKLYFLIKSFSSFIDGDLELSSLFLGYIFNLEKDKYANKLYSIPLQYTGMGDNAYLTAPLPDEYKSFINKNILDINLTNSELNNLYFEIINKTKTENNSTLTLTLDRPNVFIKTE